MTSVNAHSTERDPSAPVSRRTCGAQRGEETGPKLPSREAAEPGRSLGLTQPVPLHHPTLPFCCHQMEPQTCQASGEGFRLQARPSPVSVETVLGPSPPPCQPGGGGGLGRLIGDLCALPGALLSFLYIKKKVLFLVCKIFHHLLCLGRMFAENISLPL